MAARIPLFLTIQAACLAAVLALQGAAPAVAHHAFAIFDRNREVKLKGVVREFTWANPHTSLVVTATGNGAAVDYAIEMQSPNALERVGWSPDSLRPGDKVTVTFNPLRDGSPGGVFIKALVPGGRTLTAYY